MTEGRYQRFELRQGRFELLQLSRHVVDVFVVLVGPGQYAAAIVGIGGLLVVDVGDHIRQLVELLQRGSVEALPVELGQVADRRVGCGEGEVLEEGREKK